MRYCTQSQWISLELFSSLLAKLLTTGKSWAPDEYRTRITTIWTQVWLSNPWAARTEMEEWGYLKLFHTTFYKAILHFSLRLLFSRVCDYLHVVLSILFVAMTQNKHPTLCRYLWCPCPRIFGRCHLPSKCHRTDCTSCTANAIVVLRGNKSPLITPEFAINSSLRSRKEGKKITNLDFWLTL